MTQSTEAEKRSGRVRVASFARVTIGWLGPNETMPTANGGDDGDDDADAKDGEGDDADAEDGEGDDEPRAFAERVGAGDDAAATTATATEWMRTSGGYYEV